MSTTKLRELIQQALVTVEYDYRAAHEEILQAIEAYVAERETQARIDGVLKGPNFERIWLKYNGLKSTYGEWLKWNLEKLPVDMQNLAETLGKKVETPIELIEATDQLKSNER